ncbi:MAG: cysteine hydrolase family protein [Candidatus Aenigmatarchaeota archaeon]
MDACCNPGVIIVDMQENFLRPLEPLRAEMLVGNQLRLLGYCADYDLPVAVLEYSGEGPTQREILEAVGRVPRSEYFIRNGFNSGFLNTCLPQTLKSWGVETVIISGVNAHACVFANAEWAKMNGYGVMTSACLMDDIYDKDYSQWYVQCLFEPRGWNVPYFWGELQAIYPSIVR